MTVTETPRPDLAAVKARQQQTWASANYGAVAARAGCQVTGVDYVPALLERARARAAAEGLDVELAEGDAEHLQYPDASFDAVLSCLGVMFTPDQPQAAAELVRVCRPGGTIALANWTPTGFIGGLLRTVVKYLPPPAGVASPLLWGTEDHQRELFGDRLTQLRTTRREYVFRFASPDDFVEFFRVNYGPVHKAFAALDEAGRAQLHQDLVTLVGEHDRARGTSVAVASEYLETVAVRR